MQVVACPPMESRTIASAYKSRSRVPLIWSGAFLRLLIKILHFILLDVFTPNGTLSSTGQLDGLMPYMVFFGEESLEQNSFAAIKR